MKKLTTLVIALLFTAGIAFGQTTDIDQIGNHNEATVEKAGPVSNVDATISQIGDYNDAIMKPRYGAFNVDMTIKQHNGNHNEAYLRVTTSSDNTYKIKQEGSRNNATLKVEQNTDGAGSIKQLAGVAGSGFNHASLFIGDKYIKAHIRQIGTRNDASVDINGGSGNVNGEGSFVTITQRGVSNSAVNINVNSNTRLDIDQLGNNNLITSFTVDGSGVYGVSQQLVDLKQNGNMNTINMPASVTGVVGVSQTGNLNVATVH